MLNQLTYAQIVEHMTAPCPTHVVIRCKSCLTNCACILVRYNLVLVVALAAPSDTGGADGCTSCLVTGTAPLNWFTCENRPAIDDCNSLDGPAQGLEHCPWKVHRAIDIKGGHGSYDCTAGAVANHCGVDSVDMGNAARCTDGAAGA